MRPRELFSFVTLIGAFGCFIEPLTGIVLCAVGIMGYIISITTE